MSKELSGTEGVDAKLNAALLRDKALAGWPMTWDAQQRLAMASAIADVAKPNTPTMHTEEAEDVIAKARTQRIPSPMWRPMFRV